MPLKGPQVIELARQDVSQPRRGTDVRNLLDAHDQVAAAMEPGHESFDLIHPEVEGLLRVQINAIQPLENHRVVGEDRRQQAGGGRLEGFVLRQDRSEHRGSGRRPHHGPQERGVGSERPPELQARLLSPELAPLVEQARVPTAETARGREHRDDEPLQGAGRQLDDRAAGLVLAKTPAGKFHGAHKGRAVILDFAHCREPAGLRRNAVIAQKDIELDRRASDQRAAEDHEQPKAEEQCSGG